MHQEVERLEPDDPPARDKNLLGLDCPGERQQSAFALGFDRQRPWRVGKAEREPAGRFGHVAYAVAQLPGLDGEPADTAAQFGLDPNYYLPEVGTP